MLSLPYLIRIEFYLMEEINGLLRLRDPEKSHLVACTWLTYSQKRSM
jgi:hypothetical protein